MQLLTFHRGPFESSVQVSFSLEINVYRPTILLAFEGHSVSVRAG